ncbi:hypothetical protein [Variovorax paradoxus]|jgi:hypothetical protein|uniref:hypothetical protein n=1 Tax=Variovorax paradoxus TaxID=34073 RepID=UPI0006E50F90|nr:hypothetical protein APR52_26630 [Variovorax paradoxus]
MTAPRMHPRAATQRGQSMTETLLIASFAALALAAVPAIGEYGLKRLQTVSAARLVAWQRTVWLPDEHGVSAEEAKGASGAIKKTDAEVTRDLRRHIFRDRREAGASIHATEIAEFEATVPAVDPRTTVVTASSTAQSLPSLMNASDVLWDNVRVAQNALGNNLVTGSLGKFTFISSGYLRNEVKVTQTNPAFALVPQIELGEQVTMLTEAWNAGGTNREEKKIQGLVPLKLTDSVFYQQLRGGLHQTAYSISQVYPAFANSNLTFGLTPGDALEKTPLDRFERFPGETPPAGEAGGGADADGGSPRDKFRYYRAFPPTPVVNTLP